MRTLTIFSILLLIFLSACEENFPEARSRCDVPPELSIAGNMGISHYLSLDRAKACASSTNRKMLVMFTGYNSVAVSGQEWKVLRTDRVRKLIDEQYVLVVLYTDDKDSLAVPEVGRRADNSECTVYTVGQKNALLEESWCHQNAQPLYVTLDTGLNVIAMTGYTKDSIAFEQMLRNAIQ